MFISTHRSRFAPRLLRLVILAAVLAACGAPTPTPAVPPIVPAVTAAPTSGGAQQAPLPTQATQGSNQPSAVSSDSLRLVPAESGNEARYPVREQLADLSFPSDAIGTTSDITGALVVGQDGSFIPGESSIDVNLASIRSDEDRRDNYVRQRVLDTGRYPSAVFVPSEARGLDISALSSGGTTFELAGDLTVHGVTKPVVWQVTASFDGNALTGTATTEFTFSDFGMTVPRVMVVLSVEDRIRLEYDFNLVIESS